MKLLAYAASAALIGVSLMSGCANQPEPLYYWGDYQAQVHDYLSSSDGGDIDKQISALEAGVEKAKASSQALPPGYHAQMGMLYYSQGKIDLAVEQLQLEKTAYPESASYIDRLLAKQKKN
jgi:hypothetical protein